MGLYRVTRYASKPAWGNRPRKESWYIEAPTAGHAGVYVSMDELTCRDRDVRVKEIDSSLVGPGGYEPDVRIGADLRAID